MPDLTGTLAAGTGAAGIVVTNAPATYHDGLWTCPRLQTPIAPLDETLGGVAIRVKWGLANTALADDPGLFDWRDDATHRITCYYSRGSTQYAIDRVSTTADAKGWGATTFAAGDVNTVIFAWTATTIGLSVNGAAFKRLAGASHVPTLASIFADFGSQGVAGKRCHSSVLWAACFTSDITDSDAAAIYSLADNNPDFNSLGIAVTAVMPMASLAYDIPVASTAPPVIA